MRSAILSLGRRRLIGMSVAVMAMLGTGIGQAQAGALSAWFRIDAGRSADWRVTEAPDDSMQATLKRTTAVNGRQLKALVLYPRASSAYDVAMSEILEVLARKNLNIELTAINFDRDDGRGAAALQLAEENDYNLIFSMGSESTAWLHQYYRNGSIPVVTVCSKDPVALGQIPSYDEGSGTNFAFTSLNMPIDVQLVYLLDFKPKLKNLAILVDSKNISAVRTQAKPMADAAKAQGINVLYLAVQNPLKAREELTKLVADGVNQMKGNDPNLDSSLFFITGSTTVFKEITTINSLASRVPVVSAVPEVVQAGDDSAVMSIGISFESNAHLAAVYAHDILTGRHTPGKLKVGIVSPPDIAINFKRAKEIKLDIPLTFFESANFVYDYDGRPVRRHGEAVPTKPATTGQAGG